MNTFSEEHKPPRKNVAAAESASLCETPEQEPRKQTLVECGYSLRNFATILFAIMSVTGQLAQYISLPLWVDSTSQSTITSITSTDQTNKWKPAMDNYFVASFASLSFLIVFGFVVLCCKIIYPNYLSVTDWSYRCLLLVVGSIQGLSALLVVFSCSGEKTPPYLQAILGNFSIPITLLFR